ncbi:uncharacterized protein M421DRAFT_426745 [Didymella exigua CBS 183.55]|uniref:Uncharacterized protein n=1 Tax=Didymella exigua CBS 183.55 TaxID=1150837 RepID=A0A6A5R3G0_9PLEO|nr:uncharacterized protein M421DRAFT_426745 [Didymella exigua CBS 183.55]KAF1922605.1 hypothetical protein M421DRAFT_426745 [Didymella exigua CBS 183.55]
MAANRHIIMPNPQSRYARSRGARNAVCKICLWEVLRHCALSSLPRISPFSMTTRQRRLSNLSRKRPHTSKRSDSSICHNTLFSIIVFRDLNYCWVVESLRLPSNWATAILFPCNLSFVFTDLGYQCDQGMVSLAGCLQVCSRDVSKSVIL